MKITPPRPEHISLYGSHIALLPLVEEHSEDLFNAAKSGGWDYVWRWHSPIDLEEFRSRVRAMEQDPDTLTFSVRHQPTGRFIGSSSYLDLRLEHKSLEIGNTFIAADFRGTVVNPEMKLLLLKDAFERMGCIRVQLKTDARNVRSQRAMEKLGCKKEGVLRKHMVLPDGFIRDTVMYSILDEEWPEVKRRLEERVSSFNGTAW